MKRYSKKHIPSLQEILPFAADCECYIVAEVLADKFPALRYDAGFFVNTNGEASGHAWCVAPDGSIIDATYAQFNPNIRVSIAQPGTPLWKRYHSWSEHHNRRTQTCLLRKLRVQTMKRRPAGLVAEALKRNCFEDFERDFSHEIKHGQYWHVTTDPNFKIDSKTGPRDMSSLSTGGRDVGALMITSDLDHWACHYENSRAYAAEIDMSGVLPNAYRQVGRGFGNEFFVSDPSNARVVGVYPITEALRRHHAYHARLPQNEQELRALYDAAHARKGRY